MGREKGLQENPGPASHDLQAESCSRLRMTVQKQATQVAARLMDLVLEKACRFQLTYWKKSMVMGFNTLSFCIRASDRHDYVTCQGAASNLKLQRLAKK